MALGLVFLALFLFGLGGLDLWVWVGLGCACDGGTMRIRWGVSALLLVRCRYFFLEHLIYSHCKIL